MKNHIHTNQKYCIQIGITNINVAHILDLLTGVATWAKPVQIDGEIYYWVARQVVCDELPLLNMKPDTVYRHYKTLHQLGLIKYVKDGKKDCIQLTQKAKNYYVGNESELPENTMSETNPSSYVGNKSEKGQNSEMNPRKLGNESEKHSEMNPTYPITKINPITKDQRSDCKYLIKSRNGDSFHITAKQIQQWQKDFPKIDVRVKLRDLITWTEENPGKRPNKPREWLVHCLTKANEESRNNPKGSIDSGMYPKTLSKSDAQRISPDIAKRMIKQSGLLDDRRATP